MRIIINNNTDPFFNLASEQYLLDSDVDSAFMLWRNAPAVIIGSNQNAYAEINLDYVEKNGIKVVRRLTGGGAVFHDLGNLNYTFITPHRENSNIDFARFCNPVIDFLKHLGCDASLSGRNDIVVSEKKVSGSAQTVRNGRRCTTERFFSRPIFHMSLFRSTSTRTS
jgi:lipoate-protein ligase A